MDESKTRGNQRGTHGFASFRSIGETVCNINGTMIEWRARDGSASSSLICKQIDWGQILNNCTWNWNILNRPFASENVGLLTTVAE